MSVPAEQLLQTEETQGVRHLEVVPQLPDGVVTVEFAPYKVPIDPAIIGQGVIVKYTRGQYKIAAPWVYEALGGKDANEIPAFLDIKVLLERRISLDNKNAPILDHLKERGVFDRIDQGLASLNHPIMQLDRQLMALQVDGKTMSVDARRTLRQYLETAFVIENPYRELKVLQARTKNTTKRPKKVS